jgi:DHA1 family bicyclomycin/chloramphenicol resistance-like MFS transporter
MSRDRKLGLLLLLGGLAAMGPAALDMYFPALPGVARDLNVSASAAQLTLTTFLIGLGAGQMVAGPVSDVLGRRRPLVIGAGLYALGGLGCAVAPTLAVLAGARFLQGLAAAAGVVITRAIIRDLYSGAEVARQFSRLYVVVALAPLVGPLVSAQVLSFTSWRGVFVALVCLGAVLAVAGALRLPETLPAERRVPSGFRVTLRSFRQVLRDRVFMRYAAALALANAALVVLLGGAPFVVQDGFGRSPQLYALIFFSAALALICVTRSNPRLLRRRGSGRLMVIGLGLVAVAGLGILTVGRLSVWVFAAFMVLGFGSWGFVVSNAAALALRDHAATAGSASALLGFMQYGTGALAAPLAGITGDSSVTPVGAAILVFATAACALALRAAVGDRRRRLAEAVDELGAAPIA